MANFFSWVGDFISVIGAISAIGKSPYNTYNTYRTYKTKNYPLWGSLITYLLRNYLN